MSESRALLDGILVQEFVRVAHGDLARTTELLDQEPALINSAWDWGGGDFETALGAAGHKGRRDIAEFLLARGAHFELCAAAMLGQLEVVRAVLAANPGQREARGPHGISLLTHAEQGGQAAQAVVAFLRGPAV
jgi:hypothetical protein